MNSILLLLAFLKPGDLLLQSQPCFMCSLIEIEEGLPYSHAGVVVQETDGQLSVLEAWNRVQRVPLKVFVERRRKGTATLALRPQLRPPFDGQDRRINDWLQSRFSTKFSDHSYDPDFLWNNGDANGESYYCSELVAKLINPILTRPLQTKRMHFQKHREHWIKYFNGTPPDGMPGISPADIVRSGSFIGIGSL